MGTWYEDVLAVVKTMPAARFTLSEIYDAASDVKAAHPGNRTANDTIRRVLQELRENGHLRFLDERGNYERLVRGVSEAPVMSAANERWPLGIGETIDRARLHDVLRGGDRQGGITRVVSRNELLVFSGAGGAAHGYAANEGVTSDGTFQYSGQGQVGHQQLTRNNRVLAESDQRGLPVRVFAGTSGTVVYVGEFVVGEPAFSWKHFGSSASTRARRGLVFNLLPVSADLSLLPSLGIDEGPGVGTANSEPIDRPWAPLEFAAYQRQFRGDPLEPTAVSRAEFELQTAFGSWLTRRGDDVRSRSYCVGNSRVTPDLVNLTTSEVIEAKKGVTRALVRTAIGQVLDYAMLSKSDRALTPSILVPHQLPADLLALCHSVGISVWHPASRNEFVLSAPQRP